MPADRVSLRQTAPPGKRREHADPHRARRLAAAADEAAGRLRRPTTTARSPGRSCRREQDEAAEDSIKRLEATGEPIVTDGEQRESSFATYPITDTLAGTGLADNLAGDGQFFAIFDDGHHRQLPRLTGGPFRYKTYASEFVEKNTEDRDAPVKQAVIAPSMMMLLYPLEGEIDGLLARAVPRRPRATRSRRTSASASTPARCASRSTSPRAAWPTRTTRATPGPARTCSRSSSTSTTACSTASAPRSARTSASTRAPAATATRCTARRCPTRSCCSNMFDLNAGYFLIQCASEEDKEEVYKLCGQYSREDANGVAAGVLHGRHQPADARGRDRRAGQATSSDGGQAHPGRAPRRDRRLRLLAVQPRREAEARLAGLRARRRDAEDLRTAGGRAAWPPRSSASDLPGGGPEGRPAAAVVGCRA